MNPLTISEELPFVALLRRSVQQTRIPGKRNGHLTAVHEMHDQLVVGDEDQRGAGLSFND